MEKALQKVVIVGGGFGGIATAKRLARDPRFSVTLITKNPFFEYYPALYKLVTGALAIEVCVPYEHIFRTKSITTITGEYISYDEQTRTIQLGDGQVFQYDYLVLALGSVTNYFGIPGIDRYAFSFKSAQQALALKQHFCELFEESKNVAKEVLVERFHVTVVGGGPSGVELAGDITTYLRRKAREYHLDPSFITVDLIESNSRVLATFPERVSHIAEARLRKLGVNLYTNRTLQAQDLDTVSISGATIQSGTVIWTAGVKIHDAFSALPLDARKRVVVAPDLSLLDQRNVFVIGDGASAPGTGLAQGAIQHGAYVGRAIQARVENKTISAFKLKKTGHVVPIGHYYAVLSFGKITLAGFIPWLVRSAVDFHYFTTIVSLPYVFKVFWQGAKYRKGKY